MVDALKYHMFFCTNARPDTHPKGSCAQKGNLQLRNYAKARLQELGLSHVKSTTSGCLGQCEKGPICLIYPQGAWYKLETIQDVEQCLQEHIIKGNHLPELLIDD